MNAYRFSCRSSRRLAASALILGCGFWLLGNTFGSVALASDRITGAQAVERLSAVLGSPQTFEDDMKHSTQDFIADHFGSMAIAAAFGIAIRMRS